MKSEIDSNKIIVKKMFSDMWFRVPEYQRPYVWGDDQVSDLLEDTSYAMLEKPDSQYFLGSFVSHSKPVSDGGIEYIESNLLDGQQRITTLWLLFAVLRDIVSDEEKSDAAQECIFQKENKTKKIPERVRITFAIRDDVQAFLEQIAKNKGYTKNLARMNDVACSESDLSKRNMARALCNMQGFFKDRPDVSPDSFFDFMYNNLLLIYVSTLDITDAFRLFEILNNRGVPLRNSDILKSMNLEALSSDSDKRKYAALWESAESDLGEDFDRFLSHVRTVLVKEKARLSLLQEYEDRIYDPKEREKATGNKKSPLLKKGKDTFDLIQKYLGHHSRIFNSDNYEITNSFEFHNLLKVMSVGLPSTDWMPPLLRYYDKFGTHDLYRFLVLLDNKFSADWIAQLTPTARIEAMNSIIKLIDDAGDASEVLGSDRLKFDLEKLFREVDDDIYGRRFARYILLKMDFFYQNHSQKMHFENLSVEHVLPQNPDATSQWVKDFDEEQRTAWTNKLGNLVLITSKKNASQGRLDYQAKREKYFSKNIDTCPNSLRVLNKHNAWTLSDLQDNHKLSIAELQKRYAA